MTCLLSEVSALRDRVSYLEEELRQAREALVPVDNPFVGKLGLSPQNTVLLFALYRIDVAGMHYLDAVMSEYARATRGEEDAMVSLRVKVAICKLRRKLTPIGVEIETVREIGYRITAADKKKLNKTISKLT
jgi:hypothetical protein